VPPAGAPPKLRRVPVTVRLRDVRNQTKLFKSGAATVARAARAAKKAASALAAAEDARTKREEAATQPWKLERRKHHRAASTASPKRAREVVLEERHLQARQGACWAPTVLSVTNITGTANRTVFGVRYEHVGPLSWDEYGSDGGVL
jgi:hypothetical protein